MTLRWKTADLLWLILLVAVALAAYKTYWGQGVWTGRFLFATYLALLSTS